MDRVLKSVRIVLPPRPAPDARADPPDDAALPSALAVSRVGLWPPPRG
jgi:hypothetical protein